MLTSTVTVPDGPRLARAQARPPFHPDLLLTDPLYTAPGLVSAGALAASAALLPRPSTVGQHTTVAVRARRGSWSQDGWRFQTLDSWHCFESNGEGRTFTLTASPGGIRLGSSDLTRTERATERAIARHSFNVDARAAMCDPVTGELPPMGAPTREVTDWSRRSRARMVERFASLDYTAWSGSDPFGMVTLTYPGQWLDVAPDGPTVKKHLEAFRSAWARAFGAPLVGLWKEEFQKRGAPHFHILTRVPALVPVEGVRAPLSPVFEQWLSRTWAGIVSRSYVKRTGLTRDLAEHDRHVSAGTGVDFGARLTDPKRVAVYFLKHGTKSHDGKEYQNEVPPAWQAPGKGPGRFWGFWGLSVASVDVELDLDDYLRARRILRHVYRASAWKAGRPRPRRVLGVGGALAGGFVLANDGAALTSQLARALALPRPHSR